MFTGIIDHCGTIVKIQAISSGIRLWVKTIFTALEQGESIAVNGICLTVIAYEGETFSCDISPETLKLTTAKDFTPGQKVNLERALQLSSRLGGHFVTGHVDQVCYVKHIQKVDDFIEIILSGVQPELRKLVTKKGSVAVDGVSLTVNRVENDQLSLMLIPHTLEQTQLSCLQEKDTVNIEFDMIARIVAEQTKRVMSE